MNPETGLRIVHGSLAGLASFGLVSHLALQAGAPVGSFWLPSCLALGLAAVFAVYRPTLPPRGPEPVAPPPRWLAPAALAVLGLTFVALAFGSIATPAREWDGPIGWEMRATVLARESTIEQTFFREPAVFAHSKDYPLLQPLCLASLFRLVGQDAGRILFPALWVLMLALAGLTWRRAGLVPALIWVLVPAFGLTPMFVNSNMGSVDSGFGELFLTLCVTALAAGLLSDDLALLGIGALLMPMVKPEGTFYPLLAAGAVWVSTGRNRRARPQLLSILIGWAVGIALALPVHFSLLGHGPGTAPIAAGALIVVATGMATQVWLARRPHHPAVPIAILCAAPLAAFATLWVFRDSLAGSKGAFAFYLGGIDRAIDRIALLPEILLNYGRYLLFARRFGLLFAILILLALLPRRWFGKCPAPTLGTFIGFGGLFLVTPFLLSPETDLGHHVRSSMDRLMLHWVGAAWLLSGVWLAPVLAAGSDRFARMFTAPARSTSDESAQLAARGEPATSDDP